MPGSGWISTLHCQLASSNETSESYERYPAGMDMVKSLSDYAPIFRSVMALILFVDDDYFTLEMLSKAVELLGHKALLASTGAKALAYAREHHPQLVFTDLNLPDTVGTELIPKLHNIDGMWDIPIYILSASPAIDMVERAKYAGAIDYLDKPIRLKTLLDTIKKHNLS